MGWTRLVIANGSGRSSRLAGSAICCLSSSSPPVKRSWTFPRRWRLGCGCCRRAVPIRTIPTMLARSRSRHSRAPELVPVRVEDHATVLRLLSRRHTQLAWTRNKAACRLHASGCGSLAGRDRQGTRCRTSPVPARGDRPGRRARRRTTPPRARARRGHRSPRPPTQGLQGPYSARRSPRRERR